MNARPSFIDTALPLPNPDDWLSQAEVLRRAGVSTVTVHRWTTGPGKILRSYRPVGASWPMYWRADVEDLIESRKRLGLHRGPR